jgi:RNA polymerase sigma factor (sigma-70 family)
MVAVRLQTVTPAKFSHWLAEARRGSPEALGDILELFRRSLLEWARHALRVKVRDRTLRSKFDAEDVVQTTFSKAVPAFAHFQGATAEEMRTWLYRIQSRGLADLARRYGATSKRQVRREVSLSADSDLSEGLFTSLLAPDKQVLLAEQAHSLREALARLPETHRQIVQMRQEEVTFEEIGRRLRCSPDTARMRLQRAARRLLKELKASA